MLERIFFIYQLVLLGLFTWVFLYMVYKSFRMRSLLRRERENGDMIIMVKYDGIDVPMRRSELELWDMLTHKEKCDKAENIRRGLRKGHIVRVDGGYKKSGT